MKNSRTYKGLIGAAFGLLFGTAAMAQNTNWSTSLNIGIGTGATHPTSQRLDIGAPSGVTALRLTSTYLSTTNKAFSIRQTTGPSVYNELFNVTNTGMVSIGSDNTRSVLDVTGGIGSYAADDVYAELQAKANYSELKWSNVYPTSKRFRFYYTDPNNAANDLEVMTLLPTGEMGIGTSTPETGFHLHNASGITMSSTSHTRKASFNVASSGLGFSFYNGSSWSNDALFLSSTGNFGVGTNSPYTGVHVANTTSWGTAIWLDATGTTGGTNWTIQSTSDAHSLGGGRLVISDETNGQNKLAVFTSDGSNPANNKFSVNGKIAAKEVQVSLTQFPDYVFADNYDLMPMEDLQAYIDENNHLPNVPSEQEVVANGMQVGQMSVIMMEKIEELTLYMLQLKEENDQLKEELDELKQTNNQ